MNLVKTNNGFPSVYVQQQGLGGFWGKLLRAAASAIVGAAGNALCGAIELYSGGLINTKPIRELYEGFQKSIGYGKNEDITAAEKTILTNWVNNKLQPFVTQLVKDIGSSQTMSNADAIWTINSVVNKMDAAFDYVAVGDLGGLSELAIDQRQGIVYNLFAPIYELAEAAAAKVSPTIITQDITFNPSQYIYTPLWQPGQTSIITSVKSKKYVLNTASTGTVTTPVKGTVKPNGTVATVKPIPVTTTPVTTTPTTTIPVKTETGTTTPATPESKSKLGLIVVALAAVGFAFSAFSSPKKTTARRTAAKRAKSQKK